MSPQEQPQDTHVTHRLNIPPCNMTIKTGHLKLGGKNPQGQTLEVTNYYLLRDGIPWLPVMGEFHFSRYPCEFWEEELLKMKAGGVDIVATYVLWIHVEEQEGVFDWENNNDLRHFVTLCGKHGLQSVVRIGPFAHGECRNGGLPDWLYGRSFTVRSNDERYLSYVKRLYQQIAAQVEGLLYKDGGPIIGIQIENEYMHAGAPWEVTFKQGVEYVPRGDEGPSHMKLLKELAEGVGFDVPLFTGTGWLHSPIVENEMLPMQGGYAFQPWSPDPNFRQEPTSEYLFRNRHLEPVLNGEATYDPSQYPLACCEIGGGIQDTYYHREIVPPQAVEALAIMNLAGGANVIGYYMYHGGSHPTDKHSPMNEFTVPRVSYDFQAPLREFGQVAESYRSLRLLHTFLKTFGTLLAPMTVAVPDDARTIAPDDATSLRFAARSKDGAGFLFLNNYQDHANRQDIPGVRLELTVGDDVIRLPHAQPLTLGENVTAILPFGLTLHGLRLKYATTQLLTFIEDGDTVSYFFFAPDKMVSEYALDPASYGTLSVSGGTATDCDGMALISVTPGTDCVITATANDGKIVRLCTLTRQQAEHASRENLWQKERIIITDGTLVPVADSFQLYSVGQDALSLSVYPPIEGQITSRHGAFAASADGQFTRYTLPLAERPVRVEVERLDGNRVRLMFPSDVLNALQGDSASDLSNVYLRIDYVGDIGNAFINGKLVNDNFYNGSVWEIGVKQFAERLRDQELFILIDPIRTGGSAAAYIPTGMAFQHQDQNGEAFAEIHSISAVPEVKIALECV